MPPRRRAADGGGDDIPDIELRCIARVSGRDRYSAFSTRCREALSPSTGYLCHRHARALGARRLYMTEDEMAAVDRRGGARAGGGAVHPIDMSVDLLGCRGRRGDVVTCVAAFRSFLEIARVRGTYHTRRGRRDALAARFGRGAATTVDSVRRFLDRLSEVLGARCGAGPVPVPPAASGVAWRGRGRGRRPARKAARPARAPMPAGADLVV